MGVVKTFLLPSYGFSFGYKRKGVSFAPLTEARRNIVGYKMRVNAIPCRRYNPSVSFADSSHYTGEPRRLPPQATELQRRVPRLARCGRLPPQATELQRCVPQLSPPGAGCPHPSRCGAAPHRATFPKGEGCGSSARSAEVTAKHKKIPRRGIFYQSSSSSGS